MDTQKRWVFISGGSRGIGRGVVELLAEQGYRVIFTYKNSSEAADHLVERLTERHLSCKAYQCDVALQEQVVKLGNELIAEYGAPYAVINNAGIIEDNLLISMNYESWHKVIKNNLDSVYLITHAFLSEMIMQSEGCVINISSVAAIRGSSGQSCYAASKAAMIGMTQSLAAEVGRFNIRVNTIAPGLIETDMLRGIPETERKKLVSQIFLRRIGKVDDISEMVSFLLSRGGEYITGQTLIIDGGLSV